MRYTWFIARRFLPKERGNFSGTLVKTAICSIALSVVVMVLSLAILRGFQQGIEEKVAGFGSHVVVRSYQLGDAEYTVTPIAMDRDDAGRLRNLPAVAHLQCFAEKGSMIKTDESIHGIVLKGIDSNYDTTFFAQNLVAGRLPDFLHDSATAPSNEVVVSKTIADKLRLALGDKVRTYFWHDNSYRARAFTIAGIYNSDLADFDKLYVLGDLRQVQRLNGWDSTLVDGYELLLTADARGDAAAVEAIRSTIAYDLNAVTLEERNPSLFAWLDLLDSNIWLIIAVMSVVCIVAIISAFLIMVFEKTAAIGLLKTLGASNRDVCSIFLIQSARLIGIGILAGDAVALLLCLLQDRLHLVGLDPASYSMAFVPVDINPAYFIVISVATLATTMLSLLLPSLYIAHIHPAKSIRTA